jgi:hypothetical protein
MARIPPSAARWHRRSSRRRSYASLDRTRLVFFALLALILVIIGISLARQVIDGGFLTELFIAATVFSLGVLAIDFLGLLGPHDGGATGDMDTVTHVDGAFALDHPGGLEHSGDADDGGLHDIAHTGTAQFADGHDSADQGHEAAALSHQGDVAILGGIKYMRWSVYFCLGFGPVGWISMAAGRSAGWSFVIAALAGVASVALAQLFFRLRPADTGALPPADEMLWERATVTIPLTHARLGRVRVTVGMTVHEPFALAVAEGVEFHTGDSVRIVRVTDACVYVE